MRAYTIRDIRALNPCYDPAKKIPEDWTGTSVDILRMERVPPEYRLWVVSHWLDDRTLRLFAVWCAREAMELSGDPDSRSVAACDVAERYANGKATDGDLSDAWAAAKATTCVDARDAAHYDAQAAAVAAKASAKAAAKASAQDAACTAARSATDAAAWTAADAAAWAAADAAAWTSAWTAAWTAQINHLITMIEEQEQQP